MKKLMTVVPVAATLLAFGAVYGDGLTSTGFEDNPPYVAGESLSTTNDDAGAVAGDTDFAATWAETELEEGVATVTAYGGEGAAAKGDVTPVAGGDDIGDNYLKLDGAPLISRYAQTGGAAYEIPSEGIYIDTLVKFTPSEDTEPETTAGDKLCIWVNVDEETGATNLMVRAGYIEDDTGTTVPTNYVVTGAFQGENLDGWHRLTVIAYTSIDADEWLASGFAIKIDGNLVGTDICPFADASTYIFNENVAAYMASSPYKLFPSLVSLADDDSTSLTSIGFKGTGSIDNLQFTETNPLPPPGDVTYELTITATDDATNTVWTATTNGISVASGDFIEDGQAVVVVVTPNTGWEYATTPADWSAGAAAGTITKTFTVSGAALEITIPAPTAKSSGYDSGDGTNTFTIDSAKETALTAKLPAGKTLGDVADAATGMTYAQAYALGLFNEETGDIKELDATISVGADGKVTVTLANAPTTGYVVQCKVYEKASLTAEWPSTPVATYAYGSAQAFEPGSATAGFYKVAVVISNALQQ